MIREGPGHRACGYMGGARVCIMCTCTDRDHTHQPCVSLACTAGVLLLLLCKTPLEQLAEPVQNVLVLRVADRLRLLAHLAS